MAIRSLIYVSSGNIPSLSANSIQVVKMSQALAGQVEEFTLVTSGGVRSLLGRKPLDLNPWYGISRPFHIVQLPSRWRNSYPLPRDYNASGFPYLSALYVSFKRPNLLYSRSLKTISLAARLGQRAVFETHSAEIDGKALKHLMATGKLLAIVTISTYLKDLYCTRWGIPAEQVMVCPDGVDLDGYAPDIATAKLRTRLDLPVDRTIAIYTGHLYEQRGIEEILECAKQLQNVFFMIVGGYPEDVERRKREVEDMGLDNVRLTGFVSNSLIPAYLQAADILLMPYSRHVTTGQWMSPLKLFEYMGAGRPIIASNLPALRTVLKHRENAILVEPDSSEALKLGIKELMQSPYLVARIALRAREEVREYTWDRRASKIISFCEQLL